MQVDTIQPEPPPIPPIPKSDPKPVAPWPHTLALFFLLAGSALLSQQRVGSAPSTVPHLYRYASSIVLTWMLLGSVVAGVYHRRAFFVRALSHKATSLLHEAGIGFAIYMCGLILLGIAGSIVKLTPLAHKHNSVIVLSMMPHTALEFFAWLGVSATAGFCEELIFRGYLIDQFAAWTERPIVAIVLSAALFGSVHLYEGLAAVLPLTGLALLYGFIVRQRKGDLRAVMIAHTLQDFLVALFVAGLSHLHAHP